MLRYTLVLSSLFSLLAMPAWAHGPTPQKVEKTVSVKVSPAKVWSLVRDFGNLQKWHPAVAKCQLEKKGDDTFRTLTLKDGGRVLEKLRSLDDAAMKLKYEIVETTLPLADYNATLVVSPGASAQEAHVTWTARFYRVYKLNPPIPAGQDDESAIRTVNSIVDSGLAQLVKVVEGKE